MTVSECPVSDMISRYLSGWESRKTPGPHSQAGRGQLPVSSEVKEGASGAAEQYLNSPGKAEARSNKLLLKFLKIRF